MLLTHIWLRQPQAYFVRISNTTTHFSPHHCTPYCLSQPYSQLHLYIGLRAGVYLLQARRYVVAVEVVGGGCLERYHHPARQCGAGCECVAYAVAVECRIGKRVEQSLLVAIEAAFVVVGVKVGECGGELQPTAGRSEERR